MDPSGLILYTPGPGGAKTFSVLIARGPVNLQGFGFASKTQTYPFKIKSTGFISESNYNLTSNSENHFKLSDEELIYYVYAVLNSNEYKSKYEDELYKTIPRIPKVKEKENLENSIARREKLLSNVNYVNKAPANIVEKEREDLAKEKELLQSVINKFTNLS